MKSKPFAVCRPVALWICAALAAMIFSGCQNIPGMPSAATVTGEFPVEVNGVTISSRPQKAVVLSPSLADVVAALGYETQLAAGVESCTQESLRDLQKIPENDYQAIIDIGPDLVLAESFDSNLTSALSGANIPMLAITPAVNRTDFERLYSQVSSAFAGGGAGYDAGIDCAQDIFIVLDNINRIVPKDKVTTACYLYDLQGSAVTGDMFASTVMSCAGVTNAFNSHTGGQYDFEALRISNPNVIFCAPGLKAEIQRDSRFANFQAVRNGNIFELEPSLMEFQGRTVIEAAYEISAASFPELLEENSMTVSLPQADPSSAVSEPQSTVSYPELSQGDSNEDVLALQTRLDELGYLDTEYDGHYGEYTANCVRDFQEANGLPATGVADQATQAALFSKDAVPKSGSSAGSGES